MSDNQSSSSKPFDFLEYIRRQSAWSSRTFGGGRRTNGLTEHMEHEIGEIRKNPGELIEWVDVIILAVDGAWRLGKTPEQIAEALQAKQDKNMAREWPPLETVSDDKPSFHVEHAGEDDAEDALHAHRLLSTMRKEFWSVAVHNDYRLDGVSMTFWLFTHPSGRYAKGEGLTDLEAIKQAFDRAGLKEME